MEKLFNKINLLEFENKQLRNELNGIFKYVYSAKENLNLFLLVSLEEEMHYKKLELQLKEMCHVLEEKNNFIEALESAYQNLFDAYYKLTLEQGTEKKKLEDKNFNIPEEDKTISNNVKVQDESVKLMKELQINYEEILLFDLFIKRLLQNSETEEKKIISKLWENFLSKTDEECQNFPKLMENLRNRNFKAGPMFFDSDTDVQLFYFISIVTQRLLQKILYFRKYQQEKAHYVSAVSSIGIASKERVRTNQTVTLPTMEALGITYQSDLVKNNSPPTTSQSRSEEGQQSTNAIFSLDSDEEYLFLSTLKNAEYGRSRQVFFDYKICDLDLDQFRSCRKLSVLPEEESDDSFVRQASFKSICKPISNNLKCESHSTEDLFKTKQTRDLVNEKCVNPVSSTTSIQSSLQNSLNKNIDFYNNIEKRINENKFSFPSETNTIINLPSIEDSISFYRTQNYCSTIALQSTSIAQTKTSSLSEKIKKSNGKLQSTSRPLRLASDKNVTNDKINKFRFEIVPEIDEKSCDSLTNFENLSNYSISKVTPKFKIEVVDEGGLNKSTAKDNESGSLKGPSFKHSVPYKESTLHSSINLDYDKQASLKSSSLGSNGKSSCSSSSNLYDDGRVNDFRDECENFKNEKLNLIKNSPEIIKPCSMKDFNEKLDASDEPSNLKIDPVDLKDKQLMHLDFQFSEHFLSHSLKNKSPNNFTDSKPISKKSNVTTLISSNSKTVELSSSILSPLFNRFNAFELFKKILKFDLEEKSLYREVLEKKENIQCTQFFEKNDAKIISSSLIAQDNFDFDPLNIAKSSSSPDNIFYVRLDQFSHSERKHSDFSENSSSSYVTPPEFSSGGFCTPVGNHSPILSLIRKHSNQTSNSASTSLDSSFVASKLKEYKESNSI